MLQTAAYLLGRDPSLAILLDGRTLSRRYQRERIVDFCSRSGTPWAMLECVCAEETAICRLKDDVAHGSHFAANRSPELYYEIRRTWEPIESAKLVVDTDASLELCTARALDYLRHVCPA